MAAMAVRLNAANDGETPAAGLCVEIDRLARELPRLGLAGICTRVDALRRQARTAGLMPAGVIASALSDALARGGRGTLIPHYLDAMREAAGCRADDAHAAAALLASVGVRLAG